MSLIDDNYIKCIVCGENLKFKAGFSVFYDADNYGEPVKAKTECCESMLGIYPKRTYDLINLPEQKFDEDDWGFK